MRKVVVYTLMALDGAVEDPGRYFGPGAGGLPVFDDAMIEFENRIIATQDAVLLGRGMYDEWSRYWPGSNEQPFAYFINGVRKYVLTSSELATPWTNSVAVRGPVEPFVRELRAEDGGDIGVHGSISLAGSLLDAGLVDELRLIVGPALGFPGRRLLPGLTSVRQLELLSAESSPTGSLLLAYRPR